ncbi:MAG: hypothetical protein QXS02_04000 [Candidatus Thermoplasmatota archaeon]
MDKKPLREIQSVDRIVWITQPQEQDDIVERITNAFNIAKDKFHSTGNTELLIQTAEAFGRGLFADHIKEKPVNWTAKEWLDNIVEEIMNPTGTGATFTRITNTEIESVVFKSLLEEESTEPATASLFTYGMLRGLLLSAFPNGEVIMTTSTAQGAPMTGFVFKTEASDEDRIERERVKTAFASIMKRA